MDRFVIENIFQINAALGILYVGLPKFRFQEILYEAIVERVNFHGYLDMPFDNVGASLLHDPKFTDSHKYIQSVVALLPEEYLGNLEGNKRNLFPEPEDDEDQPEPPPDPPPLCCRFIDNRDKYIVGASNILVSIIALWILCFVSITPCEISSKSCWMLIGLFVLLGLLGQGVLTFYVSSGLRMARDVKKDLNRSLKNATKKIAKVQAKLKKPPDEDTLSLV